MPDCTAASRDGNVTPGPTAVTCPICQQDLPAGRSRRWCSPACRQAAYRRRTTPPTLPSTSLPAARSRREGTIYLCPQCDTRLLAQQRCPDCNTFAVRLGPGGPCPHCDEPVAVTELQEPHLD